LAAIGTIKSFGKPVFPGAENVYWSFGEFLRVNSVLGVSSEGTYQDVQPPSLILTGKSGNLTNFNYKHEKRQRDLAKKKKKEEKRRSRAEKNAVLPPVEQTPSPDTA
jgi:hypothetical protein